MQQVLTQYGMMSDECVIKPFGSGLINRTWLVTNNSRQYILQKINKNVFTNPQLIDANIRRIDDHLTRFKPGYRFITPLPCVTGETILLYQDEYYRLFKFIKSKTYSVVMDASVAFEAAKQFGKFTRNLSSFDADNLQETIPHFHDIKLRYLQFSEALKNGNRARIAQSEEIIQSLQQFRNVVDAFDDIQNNPAFKKRVTHHDTKISNVLFDENNKGICIIDLDTVMAGYFISDVGDMLRTYLSPAGEEETDFGLIEIRDEYFKAIVEGYLSEMKAELSNEEKNAFLYAGKFMIYMQALRFLADYLNDDIYYGAKYELHNLNRAKNQLRLLERLVEKEDFYNTIVHRFLAQSEQR
jgi:Ser/Thr protein kinase RdoA (MazF antagonist)